MAKREREMGDPLSPKQQQAIKDEVREYCQAKEAERGRVASQIVDE